MKEILRKVAIFFISLVASWLLLYFVISEVITQFMESSMVLSLIILFIVTFVFYIASISIMSKKFDNFYIDSIAILYILGIIGITFFKSTYTYTAVNLNPFSIFDDFEMYFNHTLLLLTSNTLIYVPLGMYIKHKINIKNVKMLLGFLLYIFLAEFIQVTSHSGIFDINDIILNTLGFLAGILCSNTIKYYFNKSNIKSYI